MTTNEKPDPLEALTVPEGWKMVPVEPNDGMLMDGADQIPCAAAWLSARDAYRAMLAAAPLPPDPATPPEGGEAMREAVAQKPAPEALRRPVAEDIADLLLEGGAVTPYAFACHLLRGSGPIASELARLTTERDEARETNRRLHRRLQEAEGPMLSRIKHLSQGVVFWMERRKFYGSRAVAERRRAETAEAALTTIRAEYAAEVARLRAALKLAENPLSYRHATDPNGPGSHAVARALEAVRAALAKPETTDV